MNSNWRVTPDNEADENEDDAHLDERETRARSGIARYFIGAEGDCMLAYTGSFDCNATAYRLGKR